MAIATPRNPITPSSLLLPLLRTQTQVRGLHTAPQVPKCELTLSHRLHHAETAKSADRLPFARLPFASALVYCNVSQHRCTHPRALHLLSSPQVRADAHELPTTHLGYRSSSRATHMRVRVTSSHRHAGRGEAARQPHTRRHSKRKAPLDPSGECLPPRGHLLSAVIAAHRATELVATPHAQAGSTAVGRPHRRDTFSRVLPNRGAMAGGGHRTALV